LQDDEDEDEGPPRVDIVGEVLPAFRAKLDGGDWLARLARKHRCRPERVPAAAIDQYWRNRVLSILAAWLKDITDDELELRVHLEQRALQVCRPGERAECRERLECALKETGRRGGVVVREPPGRKRDVVAANPGFDGWAGPRYRGGRR
jgi:hypothetical protein